MYAMLTVTSFADALHNLNVNSKIFIMTMWAPQVNWVFADSLLFFVGATGASRWAARLEKWKNSES